jgi:hypothetical protein
MDWLLLAGQYAGAIVAVLGAAALIIKYIVINPLKALNHTISEKVKDELTKAIEQLEIKMVELTKPIQPNSNGGKSLADVHKRIDVLEETHKQILDILTTPPKRGRPTKSE